MQPEPAVEIEFVQTVANPLRRAQRITGSIEDGEEAVAGRVHFTPFEAPQPAPHGRAIGRERLAPALVAHRHRPYGRIANVGEEEGEHRPRRQQTVDERPDGPLQRSESNGGGDDQGDRHDVGGVAGCRLDEALGERAEPGERDNKQGRRRAIQDGAIDDEIDVVQAEPDHRDAEERGRHDAGQLNHDVGERRQHLVVSPKVDE